MIWPKFLYYLRLPQGRFLVGQKNNMIQILFPNKQILEYFHDTRDKHKTKEKMVALKQKNYISFS